MGIPPFVLNNKLKFNDNPDFHINLYWPEIKSHTKEITSYNIKEIADSLSTDSVIRIKLSYWEKISANPISNMDRLDRYLAHYNRPPILNYVKSRNALSKDLKSESSFQDLNVISGSTYQDLIKALRHYLLRLFVNHRECILNIKNKHISNSNESKCFVSTFYHELFEQVGRTERSYMGNVDLNLMGNYHVKRESCLRNFIKHSDYIYDTLYNEYTI